MAHPNRSAADTGSNDAGQHYARLHHVFALASQIAGREPRPFESVQMVEVSAAYGAATEVARRRYDALVGEISAWAGTGLDALASAKDPRREPRTAAERLADELELGLKEMADLLGL